MEKLFELLTHINPFDLTQVIFWGLAGAISFYFSIGNARVWTSISTGFFLIFLAQAYKLNPLAESYPILEAYHYIIGTVAIMTISHGFLEYYVFCRTFEISGNKAAVYISTLAVLVVSAVFLYINPLPSPYTIRNIAIIENTVWIFLSIINLELIRKIFGAIRDSDISKGFIAFGIVFVCIFLWKGSVLYLQIFQWDTDWQNIIALMTEETSDIETYIERVKFSREISKYAGLLSGISVGGTFMYIYRLLK